MTPNSNLPDIYRVESEIFVLDENESLKQELLLNSNIKVFPDMNALKKAILLIWSPLSRIR
nr:hypothetical protein [Niallia taxi]